MANNQTYSTTIFINDEQAVSKLAALRKQVKQLEQDRYKALESGDAKAFRKAERQINACKKEMKSLQTTAQSIDNVLDNLSTANFCIYRVIEVG